MKGGEEGREGESEGDRQHLRDGRRGGVGRMEGEISHVYSSTDISTRAQLVTFKLELSTGSYISTRCVSCQGMGFA